MKIHITFVLLGLSLFPFAAHAADSSPDLAQPIISIEGKNVTAVSAMEIIQNAVSDSSNGQSNLLIVYSQEATSQMIDNATKGQPARSTFSLKAISPAEAFRFVLPNYDLTWKTIANAVVISTPTENTAEQGAAANP